MKVWKYFIAGLCIPFNILLITFGIIIEDVWAILIALISLSLVCVPILRDYNAQKEKERKEKKDKRSSSG